MRQFVGSDKAERKLQVPYQDWQKGDGVKTVFQLAKTPSRVDDLAVHVAGLRKRPKDATGANDFTWDRTKPNQVTFPAAPAAVDVLFEVSSV